MKTYASGFVWILHLILHICSLNEHLMFVESACAKTQAKTLQSVLCQKGSHEIQLNMMFMSVSEMK
jgi:hypothetical protein